jgi:hypothetical protein
VSPWPESNKSEKRSTHDIGPVEYVIVGFLENNFRGKLAPPALPDLIESATVRILDLVAVARDPTALPSH